MKTPRYLGILGIFVTSLSIYPYPLQAEDSSSDIKLKCLIGNKSWSWTWDSVQKTLSLGGTPMYLKGEGNMRQGQGQVIKEGSRFAIRARKSAIFLDLESHKMTLVGSMNVNVERAHCKVLE